MKYTITAASRLTILYIKYVLLQICRVLIHTQHHPRHTVEPSNYILLPEDLNLFALIPLFIMEF